MASNKKDQLKELLDKQHNWPDTFNFKFIYKADQNTETRLKDIFPDNSEFKIKISTKQNFNSMNVHHLAKNSQEVMDIYKKAAEIEGVISL